MGIFGSSIRIYLHLARQDVALLPGDRTTGNYLDPRIPILVKVQLDFRVGLEFDDACFSQVNRGSYLTGRFDYRSGQDSSTSTEVVSVDSDRLVVFRNQSRRNRPLRQGRSRRRIWQASL